MIFRGGRPSSTTQARWPWKTRVSMGGTLHHHRSNTRRSLSTTRQENGGKRRVTRGMQSNYDDSTHRRQRVFSSNDPLNPEHEAIGRVPWAKSTIRVIFLQYTRGLKPSSRTKNINKL
jgi:hypothetical protein